jgi:putative FmdB family regulatory protein
LPIYEYLCEKCGHEFEREQRITDDPVKVCPACRAKKVRRLISRTAFVLKGSGWYSDLYSSSKPDGDAADKKEATGAAASESSDKPAAATESTTKPDGSGKTKSKGKKKSAKAA